MNPNAWQSMPDLENKENYFTDYLITVCQLIPNVAVAGLFWIPADKQLQVLAKYPEISTDLAPLLGISEQTMEDACGLVQSYKGAVDANHLVGFPLLISEKPQLIIAMAVQANSEAELQNVMGQIEWSLGQLERYFLDQKLSELDKRSQISIQSNQILGKVLSQTSFIEAVVSLVESLAQYTKSERVTLGKFEGLKSRILAISNTLDFSQKLALVESIQSAQLEAQMQMHACLFPPEAPLSPSIIRAHETLSVSQGHHSVLTLLIYDHKKQKPLFAVTFERHGKHPFKEKDVESLSDIVALSGAVIVDKWQGEQSSFYRFKQGMVNQFVRLLGPGYTMRKVFLLAVITLTSFFYWLPGDYRLSVDANLEASEQFFVTMPYDGYLLSSSARAGDFVEIGQNIATLDKRSYELELLKAQGKRQQLLTEFSVAQSEEDRAKMAVLQSKIKQVEADIRLATLFLTRADIKAPMTGLVIEGDLTQRLGDAIKTGEALFTVAKDQMYRVRMQIPESRVMDVKPGQEGQLILQSLPDKVFKIKLNKVTPMQLVEEGEHFYAAEADMMGSQDGLKNGVLKPGMQGVAKIDIDRRNQFGIWVRDSYEWFILTWWRWFGD